MFCPKCGTDHGDRAVRFCPVCGTDINAGVSQNQNVSHNQHVPQSQYVPQRQSAPVRQSGQAANANPKTGMSLGTKIALILVAAVVLFAVVIEVLSLFTDPWARKEDSEPEQVETVPTEPPVYMPDCVGMYYEEANEFFLAENYTPTFTFEFDEVVEMDRIISQNIPEGTELPADEPIVFVVSKGRDIAPEGYNQKVVVTAGAGSSYATMTLFDWEDGQWVSKFSCDATVGKKGIASDYREGSKKTPLGTFKLGVAMSANSISNADWPFYRVTSDTCVVDDSSSPMYNTIQSKRSLPSWVSYDPIGNTIVQGYCNVCIYIEHNGSGLSTENVVPGMGSVITICGRNPGLVPTNGCVDISAADMNTLLELLDYSKDPHIEITVQ